jgi:hypothetical protein
MFERPKWRPALFAAAAFVFLLPLRSFAFVETTVTEGELPASVNGVWLVVSHLQFAKTTPTPGADSAAGSPAPVATPAAADAKHNDGTANVRTFNVVNLLKIVHLGKAGARAMREDEESREQASIAKAKKLLEEEQKKSATIPVQTETGEVEGEAKIVVPTVPPVRQVSPDDYADVSLLDVELPKEIQDAVDNAQKAEKPWTPSTKELAAIKSSWSTLKPKVPSEYSKIEWKVTAADKFDESLQQDEATNGAKFMISGNQELIPKPGVPKSNVVVFGAKKIAPTVIEGGHVRAMMATAPFPLPIEMKGAFVMYKIADVPKPGADAATKPGNDGAHAGATPTAKPAKGKRK